MDSPPIKSNLAEARQLVNLILSTNPEAYLSKAVRDKNYYCITPEKVLIVCDKYRVSYSDCYRTVLHQTRECSLSVTRMVCVTSDCDNDCHSAVTVVVLILQHGSQTRFTWTVA